MFKSFQFHAIITAAEIFVSAIEQLKDFIDILCEERLNNFFNKQEVWNLAEVHFQHSKDAIFKWLCRNFLGYMNDLSSSTAKLKHASELQVNN